VRSKLALNIASSLARRRDHTTQRKNGQTYISMSPLEGELPNQSDQEPFGTSLSNLEQQENGIGFIYATLDIMASRWDLADVVVVLVNQSLGAQVFRLGGKRIPRWSAGRLAPGLYCWPDVVPDPDRDLAHVACQRAFSEHILRRSAAREGSRVEESIITSEESGKSAPSDDTEGRVISETGSDPRRSDTQREIRETAPSTGAHARQTLSRVLLFVDIVIFVMTVADVHGGLRFLFGLILGVVIPGWSLVGLLKLNNAALEIALTLASSLSIVMVAAQVLITLNLWHPIVLEEITCLLCAPALAVQSRFPLKVKWRR
jgi:hypothetical protein